MRNTDCIPFAGFYGRIELAILLVYRSMLPNQNLPTSFKRSPSPLNSLFAKFVLVLGRVVHIRDAGDSGQRVRGSSTCPRVSLSPSWTVMDRQQVTAVPGQPHNAHTRLWTKLSYSLEKYAACPQSHPAIVPSRLRALTSGLQPCLSSLTSALL